MIRHISIFTLANKNEINDLICLLEEVGCDCELIVKSQVGVNLTEFANPAVAGPDFGDVVQMIDFNNKEDLNAYPLSKEHQKLFHYGPMMKKVTAIDFELTAK